MCTAFTVRTQQENTYFGRTMDFSYPLDPELYWIPQGYEWVNMLSTHRIRDRFAFMGIGQSLPSLVFADGVNERGFAAAALYFPGYAQYDSIEPHSFGHASIAAIELIHFMLGQCACVEDAAPLLRSIRIVGVKDSITDSIAPLHWIIADQRGKCVTIEKTADGLQFMENSIGVLSNSPCFSWHMTNLRNYMNISPSQKQKAAWGKASLTPFGHGAGTFGLPGDYTPPSRFVRAAYLKSHATIPSDQRGAVTACFHLAESVSIPKGVVMTNRGTSDYTQYTAFISLTTKEYFFKTYDNSKIIPIQFPQKNVHGKIRSLGKLSALHN